jgi:hypothetical protein
MGRAFGPCAGRPAGQPAWPLAGGGGSARTSTRSRGRTWQQVRLQTAAGTPGGGAGAPGAGRRRRPTRPRHRRRARPGSRGHRADLAGPLKRPRRPRIAVLLLASPAGATPQDPWQRIRRAAQLASCPTATRPRRLQAPAPRPGAPLLSLLSPLTPPPSWWGPRPPCPRGVAVASLRTRPGHLPRPAPPSFRRRRPPHWHA